MAGVTRVAAAARRQQAAGCSAGGSCWNAVSLQGWGPRGHTVMLTPLLRHQLSNPVSISLPPRLLLHPSATSARHTKDPCATSLLRATKGRTAGCSRRMGSSVDIQGGSAGQRGGSVSLHPPRPHPPPWRRLLGRAVLAGSAPLLCPPLPVMHRHLERPLMSMKYPSEQIAIELNLHQPPA